MSFIVSIKSGFKKSFDFKGRASRSEFYYWILFSYLFLIISIMINETLAGLIILTFIPSISISVRRLHDLDRTGWWTLVSILLPFVIIYLMAKKGTKGKNSYGEDPIEDKSLTADEPAEQEQKSKPEAQKGNQSVADSPEGTSTEPVESSGDSVEDFRSFLASKYPELKLPTGKKYVELPIGKGILVCCMIKKDGVNVYLYSGGKVPAREVFDKLISLGITGKVINKKYTITPMPGSRNPNVVRIDLLVPYDGKDLNSNDLRNEVNEVYNQLLELCKELI